MYMLANDGLALWIERDRTDRGPVACPTGPACRMSLAGLEIRLMACSQDRLVLQRVSLRRRDVADAAVAMLEVVPAHEVASPEAGVFKGGEAAHREFGAVLRRLEERLDEGVVVGGREYDGLTPSQCSMASTVVALSVLPLSPWSTGLSVIAWMPSASAVRLSRLTAWSASSASWISQPTILRL